MEYIAIQDLETPRLLLRKLTMEDVPQYFRRLFGSSSVAEGMLWDPHKDISESAAAVQKVLRRYAEGNCYRWGIALKRDNSLIGVIEVLRFEEETGKCSFAYMLGEDFWGKGYGTEAVEAAFGFAFEKLKVSAVVADHFAENPASGAVMRKAGMHYTRTIPKKYEKNGIAHNAVEYQITKEDWEKKTRC